MVSILRTSSIELISSVEFHNQFWIIDANIYQIYPIFQSIPAKQLFLVDAKEKNKNLGLVQTILDQIIINKLSRSGTIYGVGGGITTDIAGLVASLYMRGCILKLIPTSIIAIMDAAWGGKTGVNSTESKNTFGTFYPAHEVIICSEMLHTLPEKEKLSGLGEIAKIALLDQSPLSSILLNGYAFSDEVLFQCIETKMRYCKSDLMDNGERRKLNLGHTFAHVLEVISDYRIAHGIAVAYGIKCAARLSRHLSLINEEIEERIVRLIDALSFPIMDSTMLLKNRERIYNALTLDKKHRNELHMVLFIDWQKVAIQTVDIKLAYEEIMSL